MEVTSPTERLGELQRKLQEYFDVGVRLAWIIDGAACTVDVYRSPNDRRRLTETATLNGEKVPPGFTLPFAGIFE